MLCRMDIRNIRKRLGLNQAELGERLDLTQSTVSRMETGDMPVDKRTALALQALIAQHEAGLDQAPESAAA